MDLFEIAYDVTSHAPTVHVKDTTALYSLTAAFRSPESVIVDIDEKLAGMAVPEDLPPEFGFLGQAGTPIFLLDITQQEGLPWPGWSTERLLETLPASVHVSNPDEAVTIAIKVNGPGNVFTFQPDAQGLPVARYIDTVDAAPDVIPVGQSTHVHTSWVFTAAGDYTLTATPTLSTSQGPLTGAPSTFRFHIGSRLVTPVEPQVVSVSGGDPAKYSVGAQVHLRAAETPDVPAPRYDWYRFDGGYELLSGEHLDELHVVAMVAGGTLYSAALIAPATGRILGLGTAPVTVE
jgi:surface-anchored protein